MTGAQLQDLSNLASYGGFQLPMRHNLLINLPYKFIVNSLVTSVNLNQHNCCIQLLESVTFVSIQSCKAFIRELQHAWKRRNRSVMERSIYV